MTWRTENQTLKSINWWPMSWPCLLPNVWSSRTLPSGVKAALAAEMGCIAVTTEFTKRGVHESGLLDDGWIVDSPSDLHDVAERFIAEKASQIE